MASIDAASVRSKIPLPRGPKRPWLGWALFLLGAIWLYDAYDGRGAQGPWPASTLFPW
jgi:hypothetical protein